MSEILLSELRAVCNRIEIIKNNTSVEFEKGLASDCFNAINGLTENVSSIIDNENDDDTD